MRILVPAKIIRPRRHHAASVDSVSHKWMFKFIFVDWDLTGEPFTSTLLGHDDAQIEIQSNVVAGSRIDPATYVFISTRSTCPYRSSARPIT